jgi:GTPase SAR1 family protein
MLGDTCSLFIVGNKIDLENKRNVPKEEAEEQLFRNHLKTNLHFRFARSVQAQFAECSAKENIGIERIFDELTRSKFAFISTLILSSAMIKNNADLMESKLRRNPSLRRQGSRRQIRVQNEPVAPVNRKCC